MLVDTHCHLGDGQFDRDRDVVVARAGASGVGHIVIIADSADTTDQAVALAQQLHLSATAGVHPHEASGWNVDVGERIAAALHDPTVVAVGETGLDYHYTHSPPTVQRRVFAEQCRLAAEFQKPVIVHAREADEDIRAMLLEFGNTVPAVVLHSFSSGPAVFETGMELGTYFGFSGMVTFRNWKFTDLVTACPADRLLVETDAPYLAPVPHRGKRNEPSFVRHVAVRVAEVRGMSVDALSRQTTENAGRCFGTRVTEYHS